MKLLHRLLLSIGLILCLAASAIAGPINYIETAYATGSLGGVPFTNALVTLTVASDTSTVTSEMTIIGRPWLSNLGIATVNISGLGTATFTDIIGAWTEGGIAPDGTPGGWAGVYDHTKSNLVIGSTIDPAFQLYDLKSPIGPISGQALFNHGSYFGPGTAFPTTSGNLIFASVAGNSTFTATTAVPEPSLLLLLGLGLGSVCVVGWRWKNAHRL